MTLSQLRAHPVDALSRNIYLFEYQGESKPSSGMVGNMGSSASASSCHVLTYQPGGSPGIDYYFPYGTEPRGVSVDEPIDGAIAITGGMNGCALQVNAIGGKMVFYHDNNSDRMHRAEPPEAGTMVCRIPVSAYWDGAWYAANNFKDTVIIYQFILVHRGGNWHVGCFRFLQDVFAGKIKKDQKMLTQTYKVRSCGPGLGPAIKSSYVGYFNPSKPLILGRGK